MLAQPIKHLLPYSVKKENLTLSKYKLLLFDLDGTIVNSTYDIGDAMNHTFQIFGKPSIPYEDIPAMVGGGIKSLLRNGFGENIDLAQVHQVFSDYYATNYVNKTRPYEGVIDTLDQLTAIKKGIYSNKPHELTIGIIEQLNLMQHFDWVQGAQPNIYKPKPSPKGIFHALDQLDILPSETLFIGDSTHDIVAGKNAGTDTCAVTYGYRSKEMLLAEKPDFMIDSFEELLNIL